MNPFTSSIVAIVIRMTLPLALMFSVTPIQAQPHQNPTPRRASAMPQPTGAASAQISPAPALAFLSQQVKNVDWHDARLAEVLDWFQQQIRSKTAINIIPRWRALQAAGVSLETPVNLTLSNVSIETVLREVLDQLSGADPLEFVLDGNIIRISTRSALRGKLITRTYDIRGLLAQAKANAVQPAMIIGPQTTIPGITGTTGGGIGGTTNTLNLGTVFFGDVDQDDQAIDDEEIEDRFTERLTRLITTTIAPQSWDVNGGTGSLSIFEGMLIVRNSADVHAQLAGGPQAAP